MGGGSVFVVVVHLGYFVGLHAVHSLVVFEDLLSPQFSHQFPGDFGLFAFSDPLFFYIERFANWLSVQRLHILFSSLNGLSDLLSLFPSLSD